MGVNIHSETIMIELLLRQHAADKVFRLHHASRGKNSQHCVEVVITGHDGFIQRGGQTLVTAHIHVNSLGEKRHNDKL